MRYLVISKLRDQISSREPEVAQVILDSVERIKSWADEGKVVFFAAKPPFTPMPLVVIHEAETHDELLERLTSLPYTGYAESEVFPLFSISHLEEYLRKIADQK